jgi:hypothetical protein
MVDSGSVVEAREAMEEMEETLLDRMLAVAVSGVRVSLELGLGSGLAASGGGFWSERALS